MASVLITTKEVHNRILIWLNSLQKTREAMIAATSIWELAVSNATNDEYYCEYPIGDMRTNLHILFTAHNALQTQAVMFFYQIFTTGHAGPGIAGNDDNDIQLFRQAMKADAKTVLGWDDARVNGIIEFIKNQRHKFTAHYDGRAARYEETIPGVIHKMMSPGVHLPQGQELSDFTELVPVMHEFIRDELIKFNS